MGAGKLIGIVGRMFVNQAQFWEGDFNKESAENVRGIACKLPLYHIQSGHLMGLADEVDFELECNKHETPSAKGLKV